MRTLSLVVALSIAAPAAGQSVFVSGGVFANVQHFGSARVVTAPATINEPDMSGTTAGGFVNVGAEIGGHVFVEFEASVPQGRSRTVENTPALPPGIPTYTITQSLDYRTRHGSVLAGYAVGDRGRRVRGVVLAGIMYMQERSGTRFSTKGPSIVGTVTEQVVTRYRAVPVLGLDMAVRVEDHLAVVPQVRVYQLSDSGFAPDMLSVWPGVGLRWTF